MTPLPLPITSSSLKDVDKKLRQKILVAFALDGGNKVVEAQRILARVSDKEDRKYFASLSPAQFTALRTDLEVMGLLEPTKVNRDCLSDFLIREIEDELFRNRWIELERYFARQTDWVFRRLVVLPSHLGQALEYDCEVDRREEYRAEQLWKRTLAHFGLRAARHLLHDVLQGAGTIGVTYGQTLGATVAGMELLAASPSIRDYGQNLQVVFPLSADVEDRPTRDRLNSTALARRLARCLRARDPVPSLDKIDDEKLREMGEQHAHYRQIYRGYPKADDPRSLLARADAVLTSVGALSEDGSWHDDFVHGDWPRAAINVHDVAGDIGGVLIPQDLAQNFPHNPGRYGWVGLSRDMLRAIATRGAPGVVVIAAGENKARIIEKAILDRVVSVAVIDHDAADALLNRLNLDAA